VFSDHGALAANSSDARLTQLGGRGDGICRTGCIAGFHAGFLQKLDNDLFVPPEFKPAEKPENNHHHECYKHTLYNSVAEEITHIDLIWDKRIFFYLNPEKNVVCPKSSDATKDAEKGKVNGNNLPAQHPLFTSHFPNNP
jgi:hypothetical protein